MLKLDQVDLKLNNMAGFGQYIKNEREKREWTQTEFGNQIGINTSAICRIENGTQKFSISKLTKLSEILKIDNQKINDLFFADKFAKEAFKYKCSESVFSVAEDNATYLRNINTKQEKLNFENE
ncbi:MAG: transcriptional regulator with XRE-family HTH domain [Flavobacteriales bacterium]